MRPAAEPDAYLEAVEWFRQRVPMAEGEFLSMVERSHEKAFMVAGAAQLDLVTQVWEALDDAVAKGTTLKDFRDAVEDRLTAAWGKAQPYRVETILRTNVQSSYSRGRWAQQADPEVIELRPFWEFSATMDSRTSEICRPLDGTILKADDPFWKSHNPPLHHSCRSTVISLTRKQAEARGVAVAAPSSDPAEGFGGAPGLDEWRPDLSKYPHELGAVAATKIATRPAPPLPQPKRAVRPAPAPAPGKPGWKPAATTAEAEKQLEALNGGKIVAIDDPRVQQMRSRIRHKRALTAAAKGEARRLDYLNRTGAELTRLRAEFPAMPIGRDVYMLTGPTQQGVFVHSTNPNAPFQQIVAFSGDVSPAQHALRAKFKERNGHQFSVDPTLEGTIRHEMAHALANAATGARGRLENLLDGAAKRAAAAGEIKMGHWKLWIRKTVSEYAATNIDEAFAEIGAKVFSPGYQRGSLPADIEEHMIKTAKGEQ